MKTAGTRTPVVRLSAFIIFFFFIFLFFFISTHFFVVVVVVFFSSLVLFFFLLSAVPTRAPHAIRHSADAAEAEDARDSASGFRKIPRDCLLFFPPKKKMFQKFNYYYAVVFLFLLRMLDGFRLQRCPRFSKMLVVLRITTRGGRGRDESDSLPFNWIRILMDRITRTPPYAAKCLWFLPSCTEFFFIEFHETFTEFYWVLPGFTRSHRVCIEVDSIHTFFF